MLLSEQEEEKEEILEVGADGKMRLKKKKFDLQDLDNETLRKLGIDPSLSNVEIAKRLKVRKIDKAAFYLDLTKYYQLPLC